jgi:guanosine-3',5'-bis(diphosphate) 3'-pyrophosphohydrolase
MIDKLLSALNFAAEAHKHQERKGDGGLPYVNHLIEVTYLLADVGGVSDVVILQVGALHDTLEDTETTYAQLKAEFGKEVAELVLSLSDDKSLSLERRREVQLSHMAHASNSIKLIKIADHCSNIISIPPNWNEERIASYREWSYKVASLCFDASSSLAEEYKKRFDGNSCRK